MKRRKIAAVVVCFNPPIGLEQRLRAIAAQVDVLIIWDNASEQTVHIPEDLLSEHTILIRSLRNLGIAAALNQGLARAQTLKATHAVLFDHDSLPHEGMVEQLLLSQDSADKNIGASAPKIHYALPDIKCRWPQTQTAGWYFKFVYADAIEQPTHVDLAISSGMLLKLDVWQVLGGFDENLFIDLVDTEYCLLMRQHGYHVLAVPTAQLQHCLGEADKRQIAGVNMFPTHHSARRHYFINRNRWVLSRRYGLRFPAWLGYEWLGAIKLAVKTLLFEAQRLEKMKAMLKGNLHGLKRAFSHNKAERYGG